MNVERKLEREKQEREKVCNNNGQYICLNQVELSWTWQITQNLNFWLITAWSKIHLKALHSVLHINKVIQG